MPGELGGIVEVREPVAHGVPYCILTPQGEGAVFIRICPVIFPVQWHPAMLGDLERRWVHRVCPPRLLRLVAGEEPPRRLSFPPGYDDPYGLHRGPGDPTR